MGLGGFPGTHPLFVGMPGMHGIAAATYAFQASDAILAVGVRFDERVRRPCGECAPKGQHHPRRHRPGRVSEDPGGPHGITDRRRLLAAISRTSPGPARASDQPDRRRVDAVAFPEGRNASPAPDPPGDPDTLQPQQVMEVPVSDHPRRGGHLHRRRPAPDVGRPALPLRPAAALDHLGRARDDGLRPAGGHRRPGGPARRAGDRHRRRRLVRDDPAGALDRPDVRAAGEGRRS